MSVGAPSPGFSRRRWLRGAFIVLTAGFVAAVFLDLAGRFQPDGISISGGWVLLGAVPAAASMLLQFQSWRTLVRRFSGITMPAKIAFGIYLDSQMARYMPGKVGLVAIRVAASGALGVPARVLASTLLIELASWVAVGTIVGAGLLTLLQHEDPTLLSAAWGSFVRTTLERGAGVLVLGAAGGLMLLCSVDRRLLPRQVVRWLLGPAFDEALGEGPLAPWQLPAWHLAHFFAWVLAGACLARALGADVLSCWAAGAALCLSIVLGFLAIVAPAGAGVREALLALVMTPSLGANAAVALGLLARVLALTTEVGLWILSRLIRKQTKPPADGTRQDPGGERPPPHR